MAKKKKRSEDWFATGKAYDMFVNDDGFFISSFIILEDFNDIKQRISMIFVTSNEFELLDNMLPEFNKAQFIYVPSQNNTNEVT